MKDKKLIQVFLKAPEQGKVKTRLIPELGVKRATMIHERLVEHVMGIVHSMDIPEECWIAGDMKHPFVKSVEADFKVHQQQGSDLGERMYFALAQGLKHASRVVLIGSDAYSITPDYVEEAFARLNQTDVVLGPSRDGGYILIGVKRIAEGMFSDIEWGIDSVLDAQCGRLSSCGLRYSLLEPGWDVDTVEDIKAFAPELLSP